MMRRIVEKSFATKILMPLLISTAAIVAITTVAAANGGTNAATNSTAQGQLPPRSVPEGLRVALAS